MARRKNRGRVSWTWLLVIGGFLVAIFFLAEYWIGTDDVSGGKGLATEDTTAPLTQPGARVDPEDPGLRFEGSSAKPDEEPPGLLGGGR